MSDMLEQELRAALADKASSLPAAGAALERLGEVDYRSRAAVRLRWLPAWLPVWPALGGAAAALAGGIVAAVLLLSSGAAPAYAGWTPVPSAPSAGVLAPMTAACRRDAGPLLRTAMTGRLVLAEQRGAYVAELYANGTDAGVCFSGARGFAGGSGTAERFDDPPGRDQLGLWSQFSAPMPLVLGSYVKELQAAARQLLNSRFFKSHPALRARERARIQAGRYVAGSDVYGRAGSGIAAVSFIVYGTVRVQATVKHGWYFAWWPGAPWWPGLSAATSVSVTTRAGRTISSSMRGGRTCRGKPHCLFAGFNRSPAGAPSP